MFIQTPQKKMELSVCNSCGSKNVTGIFINQKLAYSHCKSCGHCDILVSSKKHAFECAQQQYFVENLNTLIGIQANQIRKINAKRLSVIQRWVKQSIKVIEVGPGLGLFADLLYKNGNEITLVEHSSDLVRLLRKNGKYIIFEGEFEKIDIKHNSFDLFVSLHVIEHVTDPHEHLRKGFDIVSPGAYAFIATPNARSWQQRLFPSLSPNFDSAHLRVYSPLSLKRSCESAGWIVKACYTTEPVTGWLRVITKILRKIKKEDEEITAGKYSTNLSNKLSIILTLIDLLSLPLRFLQEKLMCGNEIVLICQKPNNCSST